MAVWTKRKICEPEVTPGDASSLSADTPKRWESEQGASAGNETYWRRLSNFFVTRHLSTSAEIALHWVENSRKMNWKPVENLSCETCWISTRLDWWISCLQEITLWHGLVWWMARWPGEVLKLCAIVQGRDDLRERQARFSSSICWPKLVSCKDFDLLITRCRHQCCIFARSNRWGIFCESALRYQEFNMLATQGSSEWNEERIKALARVLMRQARDKFAFPTERHQFVYLLTVLWQFGPGTARRRISGVWINIQFGIVGRWNLYQVMILESWNCEPQAWASEWNSPSQTSHQCW